MDDFVNKTKMYDAVIKNGELIKYFGEETELVIPEGVTSIRKYAFYGRSGLKSVSIPDSVTNIGVGAFYGCKGLASITIPNNVKSIGADTFNGCFDLADVIVGDSVTRIGNCAFSRCTALKSITIPNSVTSIEYEAFHNCTNLTSITIRNGVKSIEDYAFYGCTELTDIHYRGTELQWRTIKRGVEWDKDTGNYTIHCTDGDIKKEGVRESFTQRVRVRECFNDLSPEASKQLFEKFSR